MICQVRSSLNLPILIVPTYIFGDKGNQQPDILPSAEPLNRFSLAGVQMKFSMRQYGERFTLLYADAKHSDLDKSLDNWIVKTPSIAHKAVP